MKLLLLENRHKSHYLYIKDFNRFMHNKTKSKEKNNFVWAVYRVLAEKCWQITVGVSYKTNSEQASKLTEQLSNEQFANYRRQLCVPFILYGDLEADLKINISINISDESFSDKYQDYIAFGNGYKSFCHDVRYSKPLQI